MDSQLIKILTNIGLNDKEAKVYLACAEKGTAPVSEIAKVSGLNRVTVYDILEKLKKKGFVSFFNKDKLRYFNSTPPEVILEEFEKKTNDFRGSLPAFKRIAGKIPHPRIRYFEGIEGIKLIYSDTLTSKTDILNFSNSHEIRAVWPNYDQEYVTKRKEKHIFLRGIAPKDREGEIVHAEDKKYYREFRLVPREMFNFTNEINIYDDKVAIISFKNELIGMIIESHEITNSQRAIFQMCWEYSGTIKDKKSK